MSMQHDSVSQGRISSDNCTCCHTEVEVADQTVHFIQYTDTGANSPNRLPCYLQAPGRVAAGVLIFKLLTFSGTVNFSLGVNMGSNSIPPKTLSDESINRGLVCAHMHFIARTQKILTFMS